MPAGPPPSWEIPVVAFGHAVLFALVTVAKCSTEEKPLFKPEETIQVALAGPPKNVTRMPQKAERAPDPPKASATPDAPPTPPTSSDMAFKTPDAPKTKGDPNADAMKRAMDELKMKQALHDLSAPVGKEDRLASNPDGAEEGSSEASDGVIDAELARWIPKVKDAVSGPWHPLPSLCGSKLSTGISVRLDAAGNQTEAPVIVTKSGNASFDGAALRAVEQTPRLPTPPQRYANGRPFTILFEGKDCK